MVLNREYCESNFNLRLVSQINTTPSSNADPIREPWRIRRVCHCLEILLRCQIQRVPITAMITIAGKANVMYLAMCIEPTNELYNMNVAINSAIKNMEGLLDSGVWILPIIIRIDDKTQINVNGE